MISQQFPDVLCVATCAVVYPDATTSVAEHEAVVPPFDPVHVQFQGPVPVTAVALPVEQNPAVGAVEKFNPFDVPHVPFTLTGAAEYGALQDAVVPPPVPVQLQFHGPVPVTAVAVPEEQNPVVGAVDTPTPFAPPHTPDTAVDISPT
jgi:hypothetical protein